jgi:hypothetical protein
MSKKINCLLFACLFGVMALKAQDPGSDQPSYINTIIPPSPNASSLGVYGDYTADLYTGMPNINIPLVDMLYQDLSVSVSLSYHASGLRVDEIAPWVGLGWSLNGGGVITRTVRGGPDDNAIKGYWANSASIPTTVDQSTDWNFLRNTFNRNLDTEPDEYYYNVGGLSGRFLFGAGQICYPIPFNNVKIEYGNFDGATSVFKLTDGNGTIYYFKDKETTIMSDPDNTTFTSAWYVSKMSSVQHNATITFEYEDFTHTVHSLRQETRFTSQQVNGACSGDYEQSSVTDATYFGKRLKKINSPLGYIQFVKQATARTDLPADNALEHIYYYNADNIILKHYLLEYAYTSNRLMLNKVWEYSSTGTFNPPYSFNYNTTSLPGRLSYAQDHWGFYNGATSNSSLFPMFSDYTYLPDGGDREPHTNYTKAQTLEKITYPTGGTTQFEYEGNTYGYDDHNQPINDTVPITSPSSANCHAVINGPGQNDDEVTIFTIDHTQTIGVYSSSFKQSPYTGADYAVTKIFAITGTLHYLGVGSFNYSIGSIVPGSGTYYFTAEPGTYKITASAGSELCQYITTTIHANFTIQTGTQLVKNRLGPGLRIKTITSNDGINTVSKITNYTYTPLTETDRSSGHILSTPYYGYNTIFRLTADPNFTGIGQPPIIQCAFVERTSENHAYLGSSHGRNVIYTSVIETQDLNGSPNGKTVSEYSFTPATLNSPVPAAPSTCNDYKNGLLLKQSIYNQAGQLVKNITNSYTTDIVNHHYSLKGLVVQKQIFNTELAVGTAYYASTFMWNDYNVNTDWLYLSSSTTKSYNPANITQVTTTTTNYFCTNPIHGNVTRKQTTMSDGSVLNEYTKYPSDYTVGTLPANTISTMVNSHVYDLPVEQYATIDRSGSATQVIKGKINTYKANGSYFGQDLNDELNFSVLPLPLTSYTPAFINTTTGAFTIDSHYEKSSQYNLYDANNNPVEIAQRDNTYALIRNLDDGQVWAKVKHASYIDIAYSGFEHVNISTAFTHWNYSYSGVITSSFQNGQKAYNLTAGDITSQQPLNRPILYKVSFWKQSGTVSVYSNIGLLTLRQGATRNGWTYYEGTATNINSIRLTGTGIVDEVRLCPVSARMETYTYKQGIGLISECNENNQSTFWEYDEFNRLKLIKDQDGNIIKKTEYQYQQVAN